jgi:uncharacterized surface protein with fasciclin (FAS1) repeats
MTKPRGLLLAAVVLLGLLAAGALIACGSDENTVAASPSADVAAAVAGDDRLSQFAQALDATALDGEAPYTVFAPSDDAVSAAGVSLDGDAVKASIIAGAQLTKAELSKGTKNDSMLADNTIVTYTGTDGSLYVNTYKVVGDPLTAGNGVVYVIDGVIQPK